MRFNARTLERRGLGVLFLAVVVGLLYLSILFYGHAFTQTTDVTLQAGCQADPGSGTGAPPAPSTTAETASTQGSADSADSAAAAAKQVADANAVGRPVLSAEQDPCQNADSQDQNAGHSLDVPADVKLRGIIVGTVSGISSKGDGAIIHLKLMPSMTKDIPKNVTAEIIPKTLFGEKYVSLVIPPDASAARIATGDVIRQSTTAIEAEQVFDDLLPLLDTLQPVQLNTTLTNLATALQGRGNELGDNLARTDTYLTDLNPDLPNIQTDLTGLETLATNLNRATPDLLAAARQFSVNARTLAEKGDVFASFLRGTNGFATTATQILTTNEKNITALAVVNEPTLQVLATYSPEYPCLLQGFVKDEKLLEQAFTPRTATGGDNIAGLHLNLTVDPAQLMANPYGTNADGTNDKFDYGILDDNRAYPNPGSRSLPITPNGTTGATYPNTSAPCFGLPATLPNPIDINPPINKQDPNFQPAKTTNPATAASESTALSVRNSSAMSLARVLAAPAYGIPSSQVSDLTALLVAPQIAGTTVTAS